MSDLALKEYLLHIVNQVNENTTLEDVYKLLALYNDIETSEEQIQNQETFTQQEVISMIYKPINSNNVV